MIHKTTRSILSVLLAVLLLVTSTPLTPAFAGEEGAVSLQSESGERGALTGSGMEEDPYKIATADDLLEFADKVNNQGQTSAWAVLTADIDLSSVCGPELNDGTSWEPIGNSESTAYTGTFNGDGHTISGLYINNSAYYQGLFGRVNGGTVKDLTVSGNVSGNWYVGGVVGYNNGGTVTGCIFSGSGSVSGSKDYVGGVVGYNDGGSVENCYNIGEVSGNSYVGGVVGYSSGGISASASVTNCYNTGKVSGSIWVGGVVGSNNNGNVENCYNTGEVSGTGVGGVVGGNDSGTAKNCYNIGDVSVVSGGESVGGVVGLNRGSSSTVENCYNIGKVSGTRNYAGGVVGWNDSGTVKNCYNTGNINGIVSYVGGVVGDNSGTVENCYNTGSVSGNRYVGGVVGDNSGRVTNCYNTGSVSGVTVVHVSSDYVGGVVGQNNVSGIVTNCYNTGNVSGPNSVNGETTVNVGGVVGRNFGGTVTGCYFLKTTGVNESLQGIGNDSAADETAVKDLSELCENFESVTGWETNTTLGRPVLKDNHEDDGSEQHPYEIFTATQLENFRDLVNGPDGNPDAHAKLMNNIDLSSVCGEPLNDGTSWEPIGNISNSYKGTFNGNGHTISGLYIDSSDNDQGLFGYVGSSGTVQDLTVSGSVSGHWYVGGVVGYNNGGTVTGCIFSGSGSVSGSCFVGGVVGENSGSVINCYNTGSVTGVIGVTGSSDYVGGVVGSNNNASVENCYNIGSVNGSADSSDVGGVVGWNSVSVVGG